MPQIQNSKATIDWLGGIGSSDKGDQVSLNHTATALIELGEYLITKARRNLEKGGNVASGKISASMNIANVQTNATRMSLDIVLDKNYKWLNDGVRGVESGRGKYAFKTKYPNKKMAGAIMLWMRKRRIVSKYSPISSRTDKIKGKAFGEVERKNKAVKALSDSAKSQKALAYAISTNIKKKGIKATHFFSEAVDATLKEQKKRFAAAFKLDIIENLKSN